MNARSLIGEKPRGVGGTCPGVLDGDVPKRCLTLWKNTSSQLGNLDHPVPIVKHLAASEPSDE